MPEQCCCGCSLQTGSIIISCLGIAVSVMYIAVLGFLVGESPNNENSDLVIGVILMLVVHLILNICLLIGACTRNRCLISLWFWFNCVFFGLAVVVVIIQIASGSPEAFSGVFGGFFSLYFLYIVYAYMEELETLSSPVTSPA